MSQKGEIITKDAIEGEREMKREEIKLHEGQRNGGDREDEQKRVKESDKRTD